MVTPALDVRSEVFEQLLDRSEDVPSFLASEVPMIAFAALIVVTHTALARRAVVQPILETVRARWQRAVPEAPR